MPHAQSGEFRFSPRPNRAGEISWRPWGEAAFSLARSEDKPVLLAISAVWCHWCHVMDETTYSAPEIIRFINDRFVPVRVDNDQRPDVNRRYNMGGWPSTVFLTPDGEIVHGGTYVPPEQMWQHLNAVAEAWHERRDDISGRVAELRRKEEEAGAARPGDISAEIVDSVGALVRGQYDPQFGGFGREPKFPQPRVLRFLLDEYRRHGYPEVASMLHKTLGAMATGGMYDHVEGGFFRYATTRQWEVPHYEKMLEDNATLLAVYAEAHRTFPEAGYERVLRETTRWMDAVLWRADAGLFAGSQDADEHYYTLDAAERAKLPAPFVDRTVYTEWNALAASAYLAAGEALDDDDLRERGRRAGDSVHDRMRSADGALLHFDDGGGPRLPDLLGDLAAYLAYLLDAYESGAGHPALYGVQLERAVEVATRMRERLEDRERGGFFDAPERAEAGRVARREKPLEENALAADALLRLAALTGEVAWRDRALATLRAFAGEYRRWGQFAAAYANSVARGLGEPLTVTVVGPANDSVADGLWRAARASDDPGRITQRIVPEHDGAHLARLGFPADRTAAYVCVGTVCSAPTSDEDSLTRELARARERLERV